MAESPKEGKSKAGAGSRGTSRGADGREVVERFSFEVEGLDGYKINFKLPREVYNQIVANGENRITPILEKDGRVTLPIPGLARKYSTGVKIPPSDFARLKAVAKPRT